MKMLERLRSEDRTEKETLFLVITVFAITVFVGVIIFLGFYDAYIDGILYRERLSQMREVTKQLFTGLEDVVQNQWEDTDTFCRYLNDRKPQNTEEFFYFLQNQEELNDLEEKDARLIAVDDLGRYLTRDGWQGALNEMYLLMDQPDKTTFVSKKMITGNTYMYFLNRLEEPLSVQDGERTAHIIYYGMAQNMTHLNPYFNCEVYDNSNSVYVLDKQGMRIFRSNNSVNLLQGYSAYRTLEKANYLHGNSFDEAKRELDSTGYGYANAVLEGKEYYYAMYRMEHAEWTLLFLVPSSYVATNVVKMVNVTVNMILVFAMILLSVSAFVIYTIVHMKQKQAVDAEHRNSESLARVNQELSVAVKTAENAEQEAKSASRAKSDFLANMSHDIRTPMNAIVGITTLMENEYQNPEKMISYVHKLKSSGQHLLSLINDILDMSKIEAGEITLYREPVSLAEQVRQVEGIIRPQAEERRQTLIIRVHEIVHEYLISDSVRLRQIFINLLSNAVKYTSDGGMICWDLAEIESRDEEHAVIRITVTDNGCGMSPELLEHIYEPFIRAENSVTNKVQGTGLGMAITKNIVDLMGGTIEIQSEPGKGSCFSVTLPLGIDQKEKQTIAAEGVLLIARDAALIRNAAASFTGANVAFYSASEENEAKEILENKQIDTVLLSGYFQSRQLSEIVRALHERSKTVIFCVDYEQQSHADEILKESGADGMLLRPFFLSNFAAALNEVRGNASAGKPEEGSSLQGLKFYCAEDNELNAEILEALLTMHGAACVIYPDGQELVKAFSKAQPGDLDAILMDVQMPVMNGFEATDAIRKGRNPMGKTIPIIAMTANAFSSDIKACLDAGMDGHVAKPLEISHLERTLGRAMAKKNDMIIR